MIMFFYLGCLAMITCLCLTGYWLVWQPINEYQQVMKRIAILQAQQMRIIIYNNLAESLLIKQPTGWQLYWNTIVSPFCINYLKTYQANKFLNECKKLEKKLQTQLEHNK